MWQYWHKVAILSTTILIASTTGVFQVSRADEPLPSAMASYPTGTITAIYETTFQIDGRTVSLAPEAVLVDRHGDPVAPTLVSVGIEVRYRIQKGTTDKIDWMLVILPE